MKSLFLLILIMNSLSLWAGCNQPEYTICSITVGSDNEIKYIRQLLTGSSTGFTSNDGCINFHEFVPPASEFQGLTVDNQPWVDQMLNATPNINGAPGTLRTNCSFIVLSGHHDFADNSGECDYKTSAVCRRRNQYIYKGDAGKAKTYFYKHEADGYQGPTGPLLDLSRLMKSQTLCGNYQRESLSPNATDSGSALLGPDLLGVFLFACNLMRDEGGSYSASRYPNGYTYSSLAPLPKKEYNWTSLTYRQRSLILFGNAVTFFGFDSTAPIGDAMYRQVGTIEGSGYLVEFLARNLKQTKYGNHPDFMTCYLDDLKMYKAGMNSSTSRCSTNSSIAVPAVSRTFCSSRIDVDCSCVKSGGLASNLTQYDKDCMQKCVFTSETMAQNVAAKDKHCRSLRGFFGQINREKSGNMATDTVMTTGRKKAVEMNLCRIFETPYRKYLCTPDSTSVNCAIEYNPSDKDQSRYKCSSPSKRDYDSLF